MAERYQQSKFYYNQLQTNSKLGQQRDLWLKSSRGFRQIYLSDPKSDHAPASLYMLGKIYLNMYQRFSHERDLGDSISYFNDCSSLFPNHRLADDALFALADIYHNISKDYQQAAAHYNEVIDRFPTGDMHPQAADQLKLLSKKHGTELPEILLGDGHQKKLASVLPVKYWSSENYSRVIINGSGPVTYAAHLGAKKGIHPPQLYIDFQNSYIEPRFRTPISVEQGLLHQIRSTQHTKNSVRVILDINAISSYKIFSLPDPFRVVIDIRGQSADEIPSGASPSKKLVIPQLRTEQIVVLKQQKKWKKEGEQTAVAAIQKKDDQSGDDQQGDDLPELPELSLAQQLGLGVKTIVIDPGHGGRDPGAVANGLKEKNIVLQLSEEVKKRLEESLECKVVLTREEDTYLSLEERTAIANGNEADLFLSIHVNAHPSPKVHGIETYFLNLTNNPEAMRVAAFENATSELQMNDLQDVLADIMKNSKIKESSRLARTVHDSLVSEANINAQRIKNLGVKQAPFYVLIGAEMPAILLEVAFISNPEDAENLANDTFLQKMAAHIAKGVRNYIHSITAQVYHAPNLDS